MKKLTEKSRYIKKHLLNKIISNRLDIISVDWEGSTLVIVTEFCAVAVSSDFIADAWIQEIKKISILFGVYQNTAHSF